MQKNISALFILLMVLCTACEPAATFTAPQPAAVRPLKGFPAHLQGLYIVAEGEVQLHIGHTYVVRIYRNEDYLHKDSLKTGMRLEGDSLFRAEGSIAEKVMVKGDTIVRTRMEKDTAFNIAAGDVLKKYKGHYFLSRPYGEDAWEVKKMTYTRGLLTYSYLESSEDLEKLRVITEAGDSTKQFSLSRQQFRHFIQQGGFSSSDVFRKVN